MAARGQKRSLIRIVSNTFERYMPMHVLAVLVAYGIRQQIVQLYAPRYHHVRNRRILECHVGVRLRRGRFKPPYTRVVLRYSSNVGPPNLNG